MQITNKYNMPSSILNMLNKRGIIFYGKKISNITNIEVEENNENHLQYFSISYINEKGKVEKANGWETEFKVEDDK